MLLFPILETFLTSLLFSGALARLVAKSSFNSAHFAATSSQSRQKVFADLREIGVGAEWHNVFKRSTYVTFYTNGRYAAVLFPSDGE